MAEIDTNEKPFLDGNAEKKNYERNEAIYMENDQADHIFIVLVGRVEIGVINTSGQRRVLDVRRKGDLVGALSIIDGGSRTAEAVATEPTTLLQLRNKDFRKYLNHSPEQVDWFMKHLCSRLRSCHKQLVQQSLYGRSNSIAAMLLSMAKEESSSNIHIQQHKLAEYVGVSREYACSILNQWKRQGLIDLGRGRITLLDPEKLCNVH